MDRSRAVYLTYRSLGAVLSHLPESAAVGIGDAVGMGLYALQPTQREMIAANLARVVGGTPPPGGRSRLVLQAFRSYARYWVEGARLGRMRRDTIVSNLTIDRGMEHLVAGAAAGRGVIVALPHVGSWEYGGAYLSAIGYPMTVVAERVEPPELFDYFVAERAAMGLTVVPLAREATGVVNRALRGGGLVGLLCDRDVGGGGVRVDLFGEPTTMPGGPAALAMRTGAMLVTAAVYSGPGRHHRAVIDPPIDTTRRGPFRRDLARLTQEIATRFEALIAAHPEQWHVFQPVWLADRPVPAVEAR
ncbi:MAG: phosphatidylinositol mannoside acyltransferase [Actinomycetota bacterium]|jgi:KDO2-lipid IV(A) lauroyltransferase|nr:phosphatidylinositol mannoside acyltransferase [Actinomycetota bacterium]